jgi:hypothetical protein
MNFLFSRLLEDDSSPPSPFVTLPPEGEEMELTPEGEEMTTSPLTHFEMTQLTTFLNDPGLIGQDSLLMRVDKGLKPRFIFKLEFEIIDEIIIVFKW